MLISFGVLGDIVTLKRCNKPKKKVVRMKKIELRKIRILRRVFSRSVATSFARASRPISGESLGELDSQVHPTELTEPYIPYDEQVRVRIQLLELEGQRAGAIILARRPTCM